MRFQRVRSRDRLVRRRLSEQNDRDHETFTAAVTERRIPATTGFWPGPPPLPGEVPLGGRNVEGDRISPRDVVEPCTTAGGPTEGRFRAGGTRSFITPPEYLNGMGALEALLITVGIAAIIIAAAYWFFYGRRPSR